MNADRIQKNDVPVQQQKRHSRQAFQLVDNRPSAIAQAKLLRSIASGTPIQRAATISQNARTPSATRNVYKSGWDTTNKIVTFSATPGFGQNYGALGAYTYNSQGAGHSEPNLISMNYRADHAAGGWSVANAAIDTANTNAGGVDNRASFTLYSELEPCNTCTGELGNARYKAADTVNWSIAYDANRTGNLVAQYIGIADAWLNQNYTYMNKARKWSLGHVGGTPKLLCDYS